MPIETTIRGDKFWIKWQESLYFSGGDLDFTADPSSVVPVGAIEGTKVLILLANGYPYTGEFKVDQGRMQAIISIS